LVTVQVCADAEAVAIRQPKIAAKLIIFRISTVSRVSVLFPLPADDVSTSQKFIFQLPDQISEN
jgi:hypothetical protein